MADIGHPSQNHTSKASHSTGVSIKKRDRYAVEALKTSIDLREFAGRILNAAPQHLRHYVQFSAPERPDSQPSLTVWETGFYDFGNPDNRGDVFDFLRIYANMPFKTALAYLQGDSTPAPSHHPPTPARPSTQPTFDRETWQAELLRWIAEFEHRLWHTHQGRKALQYLLEQGYTEATIRARRLGFNPTWHKTALYHPDGRPLRIAPGITYPWIQQNTLYALKIRCAFQKHDHPDRLSQLSGLPPQKAKYMQVAGGRISDGWYGDLSPETAVILTEGEKDADNLMQRIPDTHAISVITVGSVSGKLSPTLIEQLKDAPWIAVVLDNDAAGQDSAERVARFLRHRVNGRVIKASVPSEKDITDWILAGGDVAQWLETIPIQIHPPMTVVEATDDEVEMMFGDEDLMRKKHFSVGLSDHLREVLLGLHTLGTHWSRRYTQDHSPSALVLDIIQEVFHKACQTDPWSSCHTNIPQINGSGIFSIQLLCETANCLGWNSSEKTVRKGVKQLVELGFLELIADFTPLENDSPISEQGGKTGKNSRRGRPTSYYRVIPLPQALVRMRDVIAERLRQAFFAMEITDTVVERWFDTLSVDEVPLSDDEKKALTRYINAACQSFHASQEKEHQETLERYEEALHRLIKVLALKNFIFAPFTPLETDGEIKDGRAYRDVYYQSLLKSTINGRVIRKAKVAQQLGVSEKTLTKMRVRCGVVTEERFHEVPFTVSGDVVEKADKIVPWAAGREHGRLLVSTSGEEIHLDPRCPQRVNAWAREQVAQGQRIRLKIQKANLERLGTQEEALAQREARQEAYMMFCERKRRYQVDPSGSADEKSRQAKQLRALHMIPASQPEATITKGFTRGYVRDQLWLRRDTLYKAALRYDLLREVLVALDVIPALAFPRTLKPVLRAMEEKPIGWSQRSAVQMGFGEWGQPDARRDWVERRRILGD